MRLFKIIVSSVFVLIFAVYLSFLFILPNLMDPDNYKTQVDKFLSEQYNLQMTSKDIKLVTYWNMQLKLVLDNVVMKYPDGKKLISADKAEAGIKILPLVVKKIDLAPIKFQNPKLIVRINENGRYDIEKFFTEFIENRAKAAPDKIVKNGFSIKSFTLSKNLPQIIFSDYEIVLKDVKTKDKLVFLGKELRVSEVNFKNIIKLATVGKAVLNGAECINFDIKIGSTLNDFKNIFIKQPKSPSSQVYNPIPVLKKYKISMDLVSDIDINQNGKNIGVKGKTELKNLKYKLDGNTVKNNFVGLFFDGSKININSSLYISSVDKFLVNGLVKMGKKPYIDLKVVSNKISLATLQRISIALYDVLNIKSDLSQLKLSGDLEANFNIKSDLTKLQSSGYLKIENGEVKHKNLPLRITSVKSYLNFDNNKITVKNTSAYVNDAKFSASGVIDENAFANLSFESDELPLNLLYSAFAPNDLKKDVEIKSGRVRISGLLKGHLQKIEPQIKVVLNNLKLSFVKTNATAKINEIVTDISADKAAQYKGIANVVGINGTILGLSSNYKMPKTELTFDNRNIIIKSSPFYVDNSAFILDGVVRDYLINPTANLNVKGEYVSNDGIKLLPVQYRQYVSAKGQIPVFAKLIYNGKVLSLKAQAFASSKNHLSVLNINNILERNTVVNVDTEFEGESLRIKDLTLYKQNKNIPVSADFNNNILGATKIISATGKLVRTEKNTYSASNLKVVTPSKITASIPNMQDSFLEVKTDLVLNENLVSPVIKGNVFIPEILIPQYKMSGKNLQLDFGKNITAKAGILNFNGSQFVVDSIIDKNISDKIIVKNLVVNSTFTDIQKLVEGMSLLSRSDVSPNGSYSVVVQKGHGIFNKVKLDDLYAQNAICDFVMQNNKLNISNLRATMAGGVLVGNIDYNLSYGGLKTKLQGRNISAASVFNAIIGIKDQLIGRLDFDADLFMIFGARKQYMKTLKGTVNFSVADGQMGTLGRLEHFIHASNLITQSFSKSNLNSIVQSVAPRNTGAFKTLKGHLVLSNGWAKIEPISSAGTQMSLYISGRYNMLNNYAQLEVLGRVASEIVSIMGPLGDFSLSKIINSVAQLSAPRIDLYESYKALKDEIVVAKIPQLITQNTNTRLFRTVIDGEITKPTSVRTFRWLASESEISKAKAALKIQTPSLNKPKSSHDLTSTIPQAAPPQENIPKGQPVSTNDKVEIPSRVPQNEEKSMPSFWDKID